MRKRWIALALGLALPLAAAPIVLAPGATPAYPAAPAIDAAEHARTIAAMRPPKRERPVIALLMLNAATEITDFLVPYGVLQRADVADVTVVAERMAPVPLHPFSSLSIGPELLKAEPQATMAAFDARYPDGADYVIVPAMEPRDDPVVLAWINAQRRKGAKIASVCVGAVTLAAAGLLDGRRATTHWAYIDALRKAHPTMQWVPDRRYVATDDGIITSTGISASIPVTLALIEAIAGRDKAAQVAADLGVTNWDARHRSSAFENTTPRKKTFVRNWLSPWRWTSLGVPVSDGVDEIALGLTADAYSRTALSIAVTIGNTVRSRHGLTIHPNTSAQAAAVDHMLPSPRPDAAGLTLQRVLPHIASRFDRPTADIVALQLEYPWPAETAHLTPR